MNQANIECTAVEGINIHRNAGTLYIRIPQAIMLKWCGWIFQKYSQK